MKCKNCGAEIRKDMEDDWIHPILENIGLDPRACDPKCIMTTYAEPSKQTNKELKLVLVPVNSIVELCVFDGTFDEGEGMSMGEPITWKYPNNATPIEVKGRLMDYETDLFKWLKEIFQKYPKASKVYVEGLKGYTGYYSREDVK